MPFGALIDYPLIARHLRDMYKALDELEGLHLNQLTDDGHKALKWTVDYLARWSDCNHKNQLALSHLKAFAPLVFEHQAILKQFHFRVIHNSKAMMFATLEHREIDIFTVKSLAEVCHKLAAGVGTLIDLEKVSKTRKLHYIRNAPSLARSIALAIHMEAQKAAKLPEGASTFALQKELIIALRERIPGGRSTEDPASKRNVTLRKRLYRFLLELDENNCDSLAFRKAATRLLF